MQTQGWPKARTASLLSCRTDTEAKARWMALFKQIRRNYRRSVDGRRTTAARKSAGEDQQERSEEHEKTAEGGTLDIMNQMTYLHRASSRGQSEDHVGNGLDLTRFFSEETNTPQSVMQRSRSSRR